MNPRYHSTGGVQLALAIYDSFPYTSAASGNEYFLALKNQKRSPLK